MNEDDNKTKVEEKFFEESVGDFVGELVSGHFETRAIIAKTDVAGMLLWIFGPLLFVLGILFFLVVIDQPIYLIVSIPFTLLGLTMLIIASVRHVKRKRSK